MADADQTKRKRKKQEITEAQREQQKKNRARATGSRGGYTPAEKEFMDAALQPAKGPVNDLDIAAAAAKVIMPEAPAAALAADGEQYSLFGELTPEEKLQAHVEVLSEALEEEAYAIAYDPKADEFDALYADQLESLKTAYSNISAGMKKLRSFLKSPEFLRFVKAFSDFSEWVRGANPQRTLSDFLFLTSVIETYQPILPFFLEEIEQLKQEPGRENLSLQDFIRDTDENGQSIVSLFEIAAKAAAERAAAAAQTEAEAAATNIEQTPEKLLQVQYKKTTELKTITDKLTNLFFSLNAPEPGKALNGQRQMIPLRYEGPKSKTEITLFYDYAYNENTLKKYGLDKKFDAFDFFVMSATDSLYAAGNDIVSLTKIYNEMGGEGNPTSKQLEPIYHSLLKGLSTTMTINDSEVQKAWKIESGTYREIVSPVIPAQILTERFIASGKIANGMVKINGLSPFMRVAGKIGHITAWEKRMLRRYSGRKTKRYYSVLLFLMRQIGWMRNGTRSHKITYASLYEYTGDTSTRAQQLTRDMMYRLLDEVFKPEDYITAYKEEAEPTPGVVLTLSKKRLKLAGK